MLNAALSSSGAGDGQESTIYTRAPCVERSGIAPKLECRRLQSLAYRIQRQNAMNYGVSHPYWCSVDSWALKLQFKFTSLQLLQKSHNSLDVSVYCSRRLNPSDFGSGNSAGLRRFANTCEYGISRNMRYSDGRRSD